MSDAEHTPDAAGAAAAAAGASPHDPAQAATGAVGDATLEELRATLEDIEQVPLDERVALFERTNEAIAAVLAELDEV